MCAVHIFCFSKALFIKQTHDRGQQWPQGVPQTPQHTDPQSPLSKTQHSLLRKITMIKLKLKTSNLDFLLESLIMPNSCHMQRGYTWRLARGCLTTERQTKTEKKNFPSSFIFILHVVQSLFFECCASSRRKCDVSQLECKTHCLCDTGQEGSARLACLLCLRLLCPPDLQCEGKPRLAGKSPQTTDILYVMYVMYLV